MPSSIITRPAMFDTLSHSGNARAIMCSRPEWLVKRIRKLLDVTPTTTKHVCVRIVDIGRPGSFHYGPYFQFCSTIDTEPYFEDLTGRCSAASAAYVKDLGKDDTLPTIDPTCFIVAKNEESHVLIIVTLVGVNNSHDEIARAFGTKLAESFHLKVTRGKTRHRLIDPADITTTESTG